MKYKDTVKKAMEIISQDSRIKFIGYNVKYGSRAYGTMKDIPFEKCIEMPVAENLMTGLAMGMSLQGYKPVVLFERHDFLLNGLDAIVNHIDKIETMSLNEFKMPVIIRAIIGGKKPLNPGIQHTQDFTEALKSMVNFPIFDLKKTSQIIPTYQKALNMNGPSMIVERRDLYESE